MDHLPLPSVPSKTDACRGTSVPRSLLCLTAGPPPFPFLRSLVSSSALQVPLPYVVP